MTDFMICFVPVVLVLLAFLNFRINLTNERIFKFKSRLDALDNGRDPYKNE